MSEAYASLQEDDNVKYVIGAMQPIDSAYTEKSYEEGRRVSSHIRKSLEDASWHKPEFTFQGSVTSDTHIKAHSDIDLLVLEQRFIYLRKPLEPQSPYSGDALSDLLALRGHCSEVLTAAFPKAIVDTAPGKAIHLSEGSLTRNVDVVVAAWLNTKNYIDTNDITQRGISILDSAAGRTIDNFPFLHNYMIHQKDSEVGGNLRAVIRLLKTIKADADQEIAVSSYDIAAIAYRIPSERLVVPYGGSLLLLSVAKSWLTELANDSQLRASLTVPNETRQIFGAGATSLNGLLALENEVGNLFTEISTGIVRKHRILAEARIFVPDVLPTSPYDRSRLVF
ncbi:MAG: hypothetical protein IPK81_23385 [Rhodospirillales bacterium]|nr:MAG: hypothetical protein IPK81_23385 [Rhodospirillales bacterium]